MSGELELRVSSWLERDGGTQAENLSYGELEVWLGDQCLTELLDRRIHSSRSSVRVSTVVLARWFASSWWRLRWEPSHRAGDLRGNNADWRMSHELGAAGGGFLWPALGFAFDGQSITLQLKRTSSNQPVCFLRELTLRIPAAAFERGVSAFIELVLDRLRAVGAEDVALASLWQEVCAERRSPELAALRRSEAMLGLDPETLPAADLEALSAAAAWLGPGAADEVLAEAGHAAAADRLAQLEAWRSAPDLALCLAAFDGVAADWARQPHREAAAWVRGAALARRARSTLGLGLDPLGSARLDGLIGASLADAKVSAEARAIGVGFVRPNARAEVSLALRKRHPLGRRFEVARLIGDALDRPQDDRVLPLTDLDTARQGFQRAFAAELLCPVDGVVALVGRPDPTEAEIDDAASHFGVSDWVVRHGLANYRWDERAQPW